MTDLADRLADFLAGELPGGANPRIADLAPVSGGNARSAWRFDLTHDEADGHWDIPCIMLMQAQAGQLESDLQAEFRILSTLPDLGVRAPRALWLDPDGNRLGAPALIMERIPGTTDILALRAAEPAVRNRAIAEDFARCAAELHRADWQGSGLAFPSVPTCESAAGEQVAVWEAQFLKHRMEPHPIIMDAFGWLKSHLPVASRIAVVHGDFRFGNFLYQDDRITALLDWEMAHLGDPVEDIAWAYRALWTPEAHLPLPDFVALYEKCSGIAVHPDTLLFWRLFGEIKHAVISLTAARSFRDGKTRNLKLADRMTLVPSCLAQFLEWLPE